jgi:hypothetical protein
MYNLSHIKCQEKNCYEGLRLKIWETKKEKPVAKKYEYILAISKKTTNYL